MEHQKKINKAPDTPETPQKAEHTLRVPQRVKDNIKKGLLYSKMNGERYPFAEKIYKGEGVMLEDVEKIKTYFDSFRGNIKLQEQYKKQPNADKNYVFWLLNGGDAGYKWAIKLLV